MEEQTFLSENIIKKDIISKESKAFIFFFTIKKLSIHPAFVCSRQINSFARDGSKAIQEVRMRRTLKESSEVRINSHETIAKFLFAGIFGDKSLRLHPPSSIQLETKQNTRIVLDLSVAITLSCRFPTPVTLEFTRSN